MHRRVLLTVSLLAGCAGSGLGWRGLPIEDPEPPEDPDLRAYKEAYYRDLGRDLIATARRAEVLGSVGPGSVVFLGDHHRDGALHAEHRAILEQLAARGVPLAIGLEAVGTEDERALRAFVAGEMELDLLCEVVRQRWPESWLDSPEVDAWHYRELLAFARRTGSPVFALEPTPRVPLPRRDAIIAANVRAARAAHPDRATIVVVGHTHLLGAGGVVDRVDSRSTVLGARMSNSLRERCADRAEPGDRYLQSDAGVWFPPAAR